jgi:hypothetical protein
MTRLILVLQTRAQQHVSLSVALTLLLALQTQHQPHGLMI